MTMPSFLHRFFALLILVLALCGCSAIFVPISWDFGEQVQRLSSTDPALAILFNRYDPGRETLRVAGDSFEQVMEPGEVQYHLGAYRRDMKLIYRNLYNRYTEHELRDVMLHEISHHVWFNYMNQEQREKWTSHLERHPSPWQELVRRVYRNAADYESEDFAFTVEFARPVDFQELAVLGIISPLECQILLTYLQDQMTRPDAHMAGRCFASDPALSQVKILEPPKDRNFQQ